MQFDSTVSSNRRCSGGSCDVWCARKLQAVDESNYSGGSPAVEFTTHSPTNTARTLHGMFDAHTMGIRHDRGGRRPRAIRTSHHGRQLSGTSTIWLFESEHVPLCTHGPRATGHAAGGVDMNRRAENSGDISSSASPPVPRSARGWRSRSRPKGSRAARTGDDGGPVILATRRRSDTTR